jgi:dCMP deaminase
MDIAHSVAKMSYAARAKVGCVIVKNDNIISMGWNGMPSGMSNECEELIDNELVTKQAVLHAESNALMKLAKDGSSSDGATLYITLSPCFECAKLILQSGIKTVIYANEYRNTSPLGFLNTTPGFTIMKLEKNNG